MNKTIIEMPEEELNDNIQSENIQVCVIGIGRIGLPTALSFANSGFNTIGMDINENFVENINNGVFPLKDEPGYDVMFDKVRSEKNSKQLQKLKVWCQIQMLFYCHF